MLLNTLSFLCADENSATADWIVSSFPIIKIVIVAILAVLAVAMIVLVVLQKSDTNGITAISGKSDTFYNKNKAATLQGKIKVITIIDAVCILVLCIVYLVLNKIFQGFI